MDTLETRLQKRIHLSLYALLFLTVLLGLSVLLEGCTDSCEVTNEYTYYDPVYTSLDEIRSSVQLETPQPVKAIGKIYFKDGWLFINQPGEGIHVIDNHNPSQPTVKSFMWMQAKALSPSGLRRKMLRFMNQIAGQTHNPGVEFIGNAESPCQAG